MVSHIFSQIRNVTLESLYIFDWVHVLNIRMAQFHLWWTAGTMFTLYDFSFFLNTENQLVKILLFKEIFKLTNLSTLK